MVRVRATAMGIYLHRRRPGAIFDLKPGDKPAPWMEEVPDDSKKVEKAPPPPPPKPVTLLEARAADQPKATKDIVSKSNLTK
jgi:hypothetical protein